MKSEEQLVAKAQLGDHTAFNELAGWHRQRTLLHCYRMLGSFHDAEDALQETLIKAWRNINRYEGRSSFATWLHRIATNTALNMIRKRPRVVLPEGFSGGGARPITADIAWLEPYPDIHLPAPLSDQPDIRIEAKEATRLAFVATLQLLPARQRAVLLLIDVLGWSAAEVADAINTTTTAVNSALQRARRRLAEHKNWDETTEMVEAAVDEFIKLWEAEDIDAIVRLLTSDATLAMPPTPAWFLGPDEIGRFFSTVPADGNLGQIHLRKTWANGQPAVVAYLPSAEGEVRGYGVMVFDTRGAKISRITGFADERLIGTFAFPATLTG
jgi:RNA polymerase sigma-70 factor (ECF subfamily)